MIDPKDETRKVALVFGAILVSTGLQSFIPPDIGPVGLVVGGIAISAFAVHDGW